MRIERVVVTGGRKFTDYQRIEDDLRALLPLGLRRVAQGNADGADALAARWALRWLRHDGGLHGYPADWALDGKAAGPRRNVRMLDAEQPDLVLAYPDPDSRGTWHCVREACARGITVALWAPDFAVWEFEGEDEFKPGIYIDGPRGNVTRIDTARSFRRGTAPDGGGVSLDLTDDEPRFIISTFANLDAAGHLAEVLRGLSNHNQETT